MTLYASIIIHAPKENAFMPMQAKGLGRKGGLGLGLQDFY